MASLLPYIADRPKVATNVAGLATVRGLRDGDVVQTLGYYAAQDGGGNLYQYDADSTATVDGGFVINGPSGTGRFLAASARLSAPFKLTPPGGLSLLFEVRRSHGGYYTTINWDFTPSGTVYYVDAHQGNDANSGLTPDAPLLKLATAIDKGGDMTIYAHGSFHHDEAVPTDGRLNGSAGTGNQKSIAIIGWRGKCRLINGPKPSSLTWADVGSGAFSCTLAEEKTVHVLDFYNRDAHDNYQPLVAQADVATVQASGGWHRSTTTLTIKNRKGLNPATTSLVLYGLAGQTAPVSFYNSHIYMRDVEFIGWGLSYSLAGNASIEHRLMFDNCLFGYGVASAGDMISFGRAGGITDPLRVYMRRVTAAYGGDDNFNYSGTDIIAVEEDCHSYYSGNLVALDQPAQCSTTHGGTTCVRVNSRYHSAAGQNIADTASGSISWMVGCDVRNSRSSGPSRDIDISGSTGALVYAHDCTTTGSTTENSADAGVRKSFCQFAGVDTSVAYQQLMAY